MVRVMVMSMKDTNMSMCVSVCRRAMEANVHHSFFSVIVCPSLTRPSASAATASARVRYSQSDT